MKTVFTALLLTACTMLHAQPAALYGQLKVTGTQLTSQQGNAVVLRGMSFGWHNFWPRFYNAGAVHWLHTNWGCTVVRAAMGVEPKDGYIDNPGQSKEKIKAVIDGAIQEGIYVIIDWHSHNIRLKEAKEFFTEMARTYGRHPNIIYELFNEPDQETWPEVKAYSTELIATIRANDRNNVILVGNPHWDQDIQLVADDPITGYQNIMYTVHFYAGTHKAPLRDRCNYALGKHIPIFISESAGMEASGNGPLNEEEWQRWIEWAEQKKISWVIWSVSDKDETCSVLLPRAASDGGWKEEDLKPSGIKSRAMIRKYNKVNRD